MPCSHVSLVRLAKALLAQAPRRSVEVGDEGAAEPDDVSGQVDPAAMRLARVDHVARLDQGSRGPQVSKTVVCPVLSAICAPSRPIS